MATITLKNIPDELYERIKQSAKANRRSINSEITLWLEHTYLNRPIDVESVIAKTRALREDFGEYQFDTEEIDRAKREGRS